MNVKGDHLIHMRFADDIFSIRNNADEREEMVNELNNESNNSGLRINMQKTQFLFNS